MVERVCSKCKEFKSEESFVKNKAKPSGHTGLCRDCNKSYWKQWRLDNKQKSRDYQKSHRQKYPQNITWPMVLNTWLNGVDYMIDQEEVDKYIDAIEADFKTDISYARRMWFWFGFTVGAILATAGNFVIGWFVVNNQ